MSPDLPTAGDPVLVNPDLQYSVDIFKNTGNLEITLPESDQFQSVMAIGDHSFNPLSANGAGTYPIVSDAEYVLVGIRTFVADQDDRSTFDYAYEKQAGVVVSGVEEGVSYKAPDYNRAQLEELTQELKDQLTASGKPFFFVTGKDKITSPEIALYHTQSNASGWAGTVVDYSGESTFYKNSDLLSAGSCMVMNSPAPNDKYFTSLTFYDQAGYILTKGDIYINNTGWKSNADGSVTVSMNCGDDVINNIDTAGQDYQYTVRHYGANKAVIDGDIDLTKPTEG